MSDTASDNTLGARLMREGLAVLEEGGKDAMMRTVEAASGITPTVLSATDQALWDHEVGRAH